MFKIAISDFKFTTIIGLLESEKITPQEIIVDFECEYEYIDIFVDYAVIKNIIYTTLNTGKFELLEVAITSLYQNIKKKYQNIKNIKIKITKSKIFNDCNVSVEGTF